MIIVTCTVSIILPCRQPRATTKLERSDPNISRFVAILPTSSGVRSNKEDSSATIICINYSVKYGIGIVCTQLKLMLDLSMYSYVDICIVCV